MHKKLTWLTISLILVMSMLLAACQPATTVSPTKAPEPTKPPATAVPTVAPTVAPTKPPEPTKPPAPTATSAPKEFVFGMLLVGPYNDKGWSQAHYDAGKYVEAKMPGAKMIYIDKVNVADRPGTTPLQLGEDLLSKGAKVVIFNSDDMKDGAIDFAKKHPDVVTIHASGDSSWKEGKDFKNLANITNVMGRMELGKMIAGCAAALTTKTGKIGYLGPLINDETRRLAASVYLGAKYCWTKYAGKKEADLKFKVTWIGFWFNIPGVTSDPSQVSKDFFNGGFDVVISGIDTTEALVEANKSTASGKAVWAVPYDFNGACKEAEKVCLGVPYFNWGPSYLKYIKAAQAGTQKMTFEWLGPDWKDINNPDTSNIGFVKGAALEKTAAENVDKFIAELAGGLNLWKGPLNLQDKTVYLKANETATDQQVWYLPQLLEGMEGQSVPTK
jgi:simple sugar transport system substrate-binding protein